MASDDDFELSDLLESYLSTFNPDFLELLSKKKEFLELKAGKNERIERGEKGEFIPQKHQEFIHRFLRDYDDLLDFAETGTGKTGSIAGFMEKVLLEHEKAQIAPSSADPKLSNFKRCVILVKGKTLTESFRNQLVSKLSNGRYLKKVIEKVPDATNEKARRTATKKILRKAGYEIDHYEKFAKKYDKMFSIRPNKTKAENDNLILLLAREFEDTIFWVDEAHNLNIEPDNTKERETKMLIYRTLWNIFHYAPRCKRILSSAAPALNNIDELIFLLNLILPLDGTLPNNYDYQNSSDHDLLTFFPGLNPNEARQMTPEKIGPYFRGQIYFNIRKVKKNNDLPREIEIYEQQYGSVAGNKLDGNDNERRALSLKTISDEQLEPYLRGRTFFIKNKESPAVAVEQGITHEITSDLRTSYVTTFNTQMSDFQEEGYNMILAKTESSEGFEVQKRQAGNFIFPDELGGYFLNPKDGFKKYLVKNKDNFSATEEFKYLLTKGLNPTNLENINKIIKRVGKYGCKYAATMKGLIDYPGVQQIYSNFVKGSGGILLGVCLEMIGYERFDETSSVFTINKDGSRRVRIPKKKRYALLNGEKASVKDISIMMELLNSDENMFGEYLQCIITSSTGREGISIYNMIVTNILNPEWNPSGNYQALSRGIRVDSQDKLLAQIQIIIDDLFNLIKFINPRNNLYLETKNLIVSLSGGIKLTNNFNSFDDVLLLVPTLELAIKNYKGNSEYLLYKSNKLIDALQNINNNNIIQDIINIITTIFVEKSNLYLNYFEEDDIDLALDILRENIQYLLGELSIRTIDINVVNYYKEIKEKIMVVMNEDQTYQNDLGEYAPQAYLEIKIFKHAAIPSNLINKANELIAQGELSEKDRVESIDLRVYKIGESKHHNIERVLEIMRKYSVGSIIYANINKDKNDESNLEQITNIDYGNYDILYSSEIISNIQKQIINICHNHALFTLSELTDLLFDHQLDFVLTSLDKLFKYNIPFTSKNGKVIDDAMFIKIKQLFPNNKVLISIINKFINNNMTINQSLITEKVIGSMIDPYRERFIIIALENIINNKIPITDKFGYVVYMRGNNGYFYLDKSYPSSFSTDFRSSYYTDNLIITKQSNLEDISDVNEKILSLDILKKIKVTRDPVLINEYLDILSIKSQSLILEEIIIEALRSDEDYFFILHENNNYIDIIINKYRYYIIWMNEPYSQIKNLEISLLHQGPRPGRPSLNTTKKALPNLKSIIRKNEGKEIINYDEDTELVYIHTLRSKAIDITEHGKVARVLKGDGHKRIIKITELNKGWRDMIDVEKTVYNEYVQPMLIEKEDEIKNHSKEVISKLNGDGIERKPLYGIIMDGKFRLVDKERENENVKKDNRSNISGRVCKDFKRPYLIEILWRLGADIPDSDDKGIFNIEITEDNKEEFVLGLIGEEPIYYHGNTGKNKMKMIVNAKILRRLYKGEQTIEYTYDELIEWDVYKLNFYYRWDIGTFTIPYMVEIIEARMKELDIIEYK